MTCKNCLHVAVCARYSATGGMVKKCQHFATDNNDGSKWIPISERLPKHEDVALCLITNGRQDILQFDEVENLWVGQQWAYRRHAVTHWMPMPEAPKGEDDG